MLLELQKLKVPLDILCYMMDDGGYINKAMKTVSFPGIFSLLETLKTMQSFQYYFSGKIYNYLWKEDVSSNF